MTMESGQGDDSDDQLLQKHRKERKELQSQIQALKKTATKGDKKKKREVQEEIARLETQLSERQDAELVAATANKADMAENGLCETLEDACLNGGETQKMSKAQKRREKKAADLKEREKRILEQEVENETGLRNVEMQKIKAALKSRGLMIYDIAPDGDCLYNAVDHQLRAMSTAGLGTAVLRRDTSRHLRTNRTDYLPFLSNPATGDQLTDPQFEDYCDKVAGTTAWGGQLELRALSQVLQRPITVIQGDGPALEMGAELGRGAPPLVLTYHRHMYGLGEHYNSVQPFVPPEEDAPA